MSTPCTLENTTGLRLLCYSSVASLPDLMAGSIASTTEMQSGRLLSTLTSSMVSESYVPGIPLFFGEGNRVFRRMTVLQELDIWIVL